MLGNNNKKKIVDGSDATNFRIADNQVSALI